MRTLAGIALALLVPATAAADTVANRVPDAGPALAGAQVAWGEEERDGSLRLLIASPGSQPRAHTHWPRTTARKSRRSFDSSTGALAASPQALAVTLYTCTITAQGTDHVTETCRTGTFGGSLAGPLSPLAGALPDRGDGECVGRFSHPDAVDVDGARIAVSETAAACGEPPAGQIIVHHGDRATVVSTGPGIGPNRVRLAGRYLAWLQSESLPAVLTVHDLVEGRSVATVTSRQLRARAITDFALQADGKVAVVASALGRPIVGWFAVGLPGIRTLARATANAIELAGDRVLYDRVRAGDWRSDLVLQRLGGRPGTLARFGPRLRRVGDIDLDAERAVWAARRSDPEDTDPVGPARIVARRIAQ